MQPEISFLSDEEQAYLHQAALWLLENVGMQFPSYEALKVMERAGARVEDNVVKIPSNLVAEAVEKAPKREGFILYGREEKYDIRFKKDTPVLSSMEEATHVIDLHTRERRPCTLQDVADMVRLMDAMENISINAPIGTPQDVPKETSHWYALATTLKNTAKPLTSEAPGAQFVKDAIRMASLTAGGEDRFRQRPFISFVVLTRPPFQIDRLSLEALMELSRQNLPVFLSSGPILGATSPVTLAGTIAQVHAEILAVLVLSQVIRPHTQIMYTSFARGMDMRYGNVSMASPEFAILKGAIGQMGRYLGLPVRMPAFLRDAKILDGQSGFETGTVGLISTLAADVIDGLQYDMDRLVDFADLVFSNDAMGALKRIVRGFSIDDNTLALDVIKEVGQGGNFLESNHTLKNFRKEIWVPRLMERRPWEQWERDGKKEIEQRARERAKEILASHQPNRLPPQIEAGLDRIAAESKIDYAQSI